MIKTLKSNLEGSLNNFRGAEFFLWDFPLLEDYPPGHSETAHSPPPPSVRGNLHPAPKEKVLELYQREVWLKKRFEFQVAGFELSKGGKGLSSSIKFWVLCVRGG
jgi:hypothetical protein